MGDEINAIRTGITLDLTKLPDDVRLEAQKTISDIPDDVLATLDHTLKNTPTLAKAYEALGETVGPGATGGDPEEDGKDAFNRDKFSVLKSICSNKVIRSYCNRRSTMDMTTAGALILGTLGNVQLSGINIVAVVTVVLRAGVYELCSNQWANP